MTTTKRLKRLLDSPIEDTGKLDGWIRLYARLRIPRDPVCPHHNAPFDYIRHTFFEPARDVIVWAPRGGGKTRLAALATLLDLIHKPGCSVRILGGSLEQSLRMWEHMYPDVVRLARHLLDGKPRNARRISLTNGSDAGVLTQSQRAIRGLRVQKLRCDEVEMFDPKIWEAAQLVTRSKAKCTMDSARKARPLGPGPGPGGRAFGEPQIYGAIEAISTFHRPWGMMSRILDSARASGTPVIHWCILDVLERCPPERDCSTCPLWDECQGVAKIRCNGFVTIDDAIAMKQRVSRDTWECEMLCKRPSVQASVFPSFDLATHVREVVESPPEGSIVSLAIDFGFAAPFVCLWIRSFGDGVTHVIDEHVQSMLTIEQHIEVMKARSYGEVTRIACDPAGAGRNDQTARSNIAVLRHSGYTVRSRRSQIADGLELIRAALQPATGSPRLFIHPRCARLIKAMQCYRYPDGGGEQPIKDGEHDHLIDALRYHFVNRPAGDQDPPRRY